MLKRLAILGLLLALLPALAPIPGQAVKAAAQGSDKNQDQSQSKQGATTQTPPLTIKNPPQSADPNGEQVAAEDKEQSVKLTWLPPITITDKQKTRWEYFFDWGPWVSNALLAVVGILQVVLLYFTWKTIARQAKMQQASMMQWIDLKPNGIQTIVRSKSGESVERVEISLRWKIVNNTPLPFKVQTVEVSVCRQHDWEIFEFEPNEVVPPLTSEGKQNFYGFHAPLELDSSETELFLTEGITLSIAIDVVYVEASGRQKERSLGDFYKCTLQGMEINESIGQGPKNKRIEKPEGPGTIRVEPVEILRSVKVSDPPQDAPE